MINRRPPPPPPPPGVPPEAAEDYANLPAPLRELLDAELAAGNRVTEVGHTHPAAPVGAWFLLERPVSTRPRAASPGIGFCVREQNPRYSGEFGDEKRHFFVLEPPLPIPPPPDMDAIRDRMNALHAESMARLMDRDNDLREVIIPRREQAPGPDASLPARFRASMDLDYEKWREGVSYDLDLLDKATPAELEGLLPLLVPPDDWRDVEALARIDLPRAKKALRDAGLGGKAGLRMAVRRYAPEMLNDAEWTASLLEALDSSAHFDGYAETLDAIAEFHPKPLVEALLLGCILLEENIAPGLAALLLYIHGKADERHAMELRPFWIRFATNVARERKAAFVELCERIGVDPAPYLRRHPLMRRGNC